MRPLNIKELVYVLVERLKKKDAPKKVLQKYNQKINHFSVRNKYFIISL